MNESWFIGARPVRVFQVSLRVRRSFWVRASTIVPIPGSDQLQVTATVTAMAMETVMAALGWNPVQSSRRP